MQPFLRSKRTDSDSANADDTSRKKMTFATLVEDMGAYDDFGEHNVTLKFWLPDLVEKAVRELAEMNGESMSEALRQFFVIHCYGLYVFSVMNQKKPEVFKHDPDVRFSPKRENREPDPAGKKRETTYWVQELGKNVASVKIWVPKRVKSDLQILADHVDIKLSQYLREIVISRLHGHGTLPKRPEMLYAVPLKAAEDWCEDIEIPWAQVNYEQYREAHLSDSRHEWVDDTEQT